MVLLAPLSVTAADATRPYGGFNPVFTGAIIGLVYGDNITGNYATLATTISPVGAYSITPSIVDPDHRLNNYTTTIKSGTLTVTPVPLTVTAADATRAYGLTNAVFTGTITGLVNGDNITAAYSCLATIASPPGTYPIVPALVDPDARSTNYAVNLNNGTLSVTPALLTVTAADRSEEHTSEL